MSSKVHVLNYSKTLKAIVGIFSQNRHSMVMKPFSTEVNISNRCSLLKSNTLHHKSVKKNCTVLFKGKQYSSCTNGNGAVITGSTIFSLSSGHGKCGVAVVRISGPHAANALKLIGQFKQVPVSRKTLLRQLIDPETRVVIDKGIVILFQGPQSFTGEDCVEFQVHGGPAVVSALLIALHKVPGCRQADPGEFTKRAFLNGKMDLTEVEGLGDLIHAETEAQRQQALRQMDGDLSKLYLKWRTAFIKCVADLEAFIDFSEDQNIEEDIILQVRDRISVLQNEIENHLNDERQGERLREGVHVVIIGEPNVGKSSLLNAICQRPAAIVTDIAGTTRDVIETHVNIGGYPVLLSDTAGLTETQDIVEKEGVIRAIKRANEADIKVIVVDISGQDLMKFKSIETFLSWQFSKLELKNIHVKYGKKFTEGVLNDEEKFENEVKDFCETIIVFNKVDLVQNSDILKMIEVFGGEGMRTVGAKTVNNQTMKKLRKLKDNEQLKNVTGLAVDGLSDNTSKRTESDTNHSKYNASVFDSNLPSEKTTFGNNTSEDPYIHTSQVIEHTRQSQDMEKNVEGEWSSPVCLISCVTGEGMDNFLDVLKDRVADLCGNPLSGHPSLTQTRHRSHLIKCLDHLEQYNLMIEHDDIVLASEDLRCALKEIGKITGKISSKEILDIIFRDFCIGK